MSEERRERLLQAYGEYCRDITDIERVPRWQMTAMLAFVCLIFGSAALIAVGAALWLGADVYPRRLAATVAGAWLLLAPWAFLTWAKRGKG